MTKAGMIVGIIGGVLGLIVGFFGYGIASVGNALSDAAGSNQSFAAYQIVGVAAPIACIVGAAITSSQAIWSVVLMAGSALAMAIAFGINVFTIFPVAMAGIGAVLVLMDSSEKITKS